MQRKKLNQDSMPLCEVLARYDKEQRVRLSMPGHKGGIVVEEPLASAWHSSVWQWDVTELSMTDQLYHAQGCLKDAQSLLADFLGSKQAFFLVNGASAGLMAGILSMIQPGERILVPRNAHGSIWRGIALAGGQAVVLPVVIDETWQIPLGVAISDIETAIRQYGVKAMVIVYPSYHGLQIDIAAVITLCQKYHVKLLVDMAHGGHLPFLPGNMADPVALGADIVIQGWHKTMGSLTQTAVAAVQNEQLPFGESLLYFQSTSPSYLLMASLDGARHLWALRGREIGKDLALWAAEFSFAVNQLPGWKVLTENDFSLPVIGKDCTRILLANTAHLSGFSIGARLAQLGVDVEMAEWNLVTIILSLGDLSQKEQILQRFLAALTQIMMEKSGLETGKNNTLMDWQEIYPDSIEVLPDICSVRKEKKQVKLEMAEGKIAAEMISLYPPGVPFILPGQHISIAQQKILQQTIIAGGNIQGDEDGSIWIYEENEIK